MIHGRHHRPVKGVMLQPANLATSTGLRGRRVLGTTPGGRYHSAPMFHWPTCACGRPTRSAAARTWSYPVSGGTRAAGGRAAPRHRPVLILMIGMLFDHPDFDRYDLSSLRQFCYGASPISPGARPDPTAAADVELAGLRDDRAVPGGDAARRTTTAPTRRATRRAAPRHHGEIGWSTRTVRTCRPAPSAGGQRRGSHAMLGTGTSPGHTAAALRDQVDAHQRRRPLGKDSCLFVVEPDLLLSLPGHDRLRWGGTCTR
ncbi:long-chain fatty acid--CoA ligase [Pseudonocardia sp. MCCB 268]|nr:long-chain fatty acid--CoA ligase [Pseudonocardia cytotoxica]